MVLQIQRILNLLMKRLLSPQRDNHLKRISSESSLNGFFSEVRQGWRESQDQTIGRNKCSNPEENYFNQVKRKSRQFRTGNYERKLLQQHRIKILSDDPDDPEKLYCQKLLQHGNDYVQIINMNAFNCQYDVILGRFRLTIKILNLHRNAQDKESFTTQKLGEGSYGMVKRVKVGEKEIAIKRLIFPKIQKIQIPYLLNPDDHCMPEFLRNTIKQYCTYKICSMLRIGPRLIFHDVYDLVCYNDCVEFQMELCENVSLQTNQEKFQADIKDCLSTLHALKFVHKDVKLDNILESPSNKGFVLTDFGMSHSVEEGIDEKSKTKFQGTKSHASPEMLEIQNLPYGLVNLYKNDYHCMIKTFQEFKNSKTINDSYEKNSMSNRGSEEQEYSCSYEGSQEIEYNFNSSSSKEESSISPIAVTTQSYYTTTSTTVSTTNSAYSDYSVLNSNTEEYRKKASQINFYQMKALYRILNSDTKIKLTLEKVEQIVREICSVQSDSSIQNVVLEMVKLLLFPGKEYEKTIGIFQNIVRIYGIYSEETKAKLIQIQKERNIPTLNYLNIQQIIQIFSKYCKIKFLKPFQKFIKDIERQMYLKNRHSAIRSMSKLLKQYSDKREPSDIEEAKILITGLEIYNFDDLSPSEESELLRNIKELIITSNNFSNAEEIKQEESFDNVWMKIFENVKQRRQNLEYGFYKNFMMFFENSQKVERVQEMHLLIQEKLRQIDDNVTENPERENYYAIENVKYRLCLIKSDFERRKHESLLKNIYVCLALLSSSASANDSVMKIMCLNYLIPTLINLKKFQEAEEFNKEYLELITELNFPRTHGVDFSYYYSYQGMLKMKEEDYQEAINLFEESLENIQAVSSTVFITQTRQTLFNLALCYKKQNKYRKELQAFERAYLYSKQSLNKKKPHETSEIVNQIILCHLKLNIFNQDLQIYFNTAANMKSLVLNMNLLGIKDRQNALAIERNLPIFNLRAALGEIESMDEEKIILVKKCMIKSIEPHLPRFTNEYEKMCNEVREYYSKNEIFSKAIPYIEKMIKIYSKSNLDENQLKIINYFIQRLRNVHSSRKAFKFLKYYASFIPEELQSFRKEAFNYLNILANELSAQDKPFFKFVWSNKSFRNKDYFEQSLKKVEQLPINSIQRRLWQKKLKKYRIEQREPVVHPNAAGNFIDDEPIQIKSLADLKKFKKNQKH